MAGDLALHRKCVCVCMCVLFEVSDIEDSESHIE